MRYWICRTPGEVEGPIELAALQEMLASGEVTGSLQICPEGSETWLTLNDVLSATDDENTDIPVQDVPPILSSEAVQINRQQHGDSAIEGLPYTFSNAYAAGWHGFTKNYALLLGVSFITIVASFAPGLITLPISLATQGANSLGAIALVQTISYGWSLLVILPITVGGVWIGTRIARGETAQFSDIWIAYHRLGWVLLGALLFYLLMLLVYLTALICGGIPGVIVGIVVGMASGQTEAGVISGAIVGAVIALPIMIYGLARIFPMIMPIIDPRMGRMNPADAMLWSWKRTGRGIGTGQGIAWSLAGLGVTMGLIMGLSAMMCGLPYLFFGLPLSIGVWGATYALIAADDIDGTLCQHCGYAREGNDSSHCPECGKTWELED